MDFEKYLSAVWQIEHAHHKFLVMIRRALETEGIRDLNAIQVLVLYKIGLRNVTVGELVNRGYYLDTNPSYNVRKMSEAGYLVQISSQIDKRLVYLKLSEKGIKLREKFEKIFFQQAQAIDPKNILEPKFSNLGEVMGTLLSVWEKN